LRVLLDTHALIWAVGNGPRLSRQAAEVIGDPGTTKLISVVSAYEICLKHRLGKLPEAAALAEDFAGRIAPSEGVILDVTLDHALTAGKLDMRHRDPFDRLLIAQALVERVPLVSNEKLFDAFGVERIW